MKKRLFGGMLIGLMALWGALGTLQFAELNERILAAQESADREAFDAAARATRLDEDTLQLRCLP